MFKKKKKPRGKTLTIVGAKRPCAWAQVCQLECCNKFAIDVVMETLNSIYSRDKEMWLIFWQALIESLASIHDIIPGMCGQCFELRRYVSWGKTPTCVLPSVILLQYPTTNCSVHFEVGTFALNDHDGYVQFSTNLTLKRLSYQNCRSMCINLRPPVVHSRYCSSNISMYEICSWQMVIHDRKIIIILYIGSTLGNIYSKYATVYCGYRLHLIIYVV